MSPPGFLHKKGTNWTAGQHKGPLDKTITRVLHTYLLGYNNKKRLDSFDKEAG